MGGEGTHGTPPDPLVAAEEVLRAAGEPLHWTVILDRALREGYVDPFTTPNVRTELLGGLRRGVREGVLRAEGNGVYALAQGVAR
jgi:hypothetical protein